MDGLVAGDAVYIRVVGGANLGDGGLLLLVQTGNVERVEGQTMKIYLRDDTPAETAPPAEPAAVNYTLYIIAAACVITILIAVVAVVLTKKKKNITTEPQE